MLKKVIVVSLSLMMVLAASAQEMRGGKRPAPQEGVRPEHVQKTPEIMAKKQTEMMVRELNITDSVQREQLYAFHLKYAQARRDSLTRREDLARLQAMTTELQSILTEEQFNQFMDKRIDASDHRHRPTISPMRSACDKYPHRPAEGMPHQEPQGRPQ